MNKKLLVSFLLVSLFLINLVLAEEVLTQNIQSSLDESTKQVTYSFTSDDGALRIGKNDYWNIQKGGIIKADSDNKIIEAKFYTNEKGGDYVFGNEKINVPPNSGVLYKYGVLTILAPDNAELKANPVEQDAKVASTDTIVYRGKNLKLPSGLTLESGALNYKDGNFYLTSGDKIRISGISIEDLGIKENLNLYFDSSTAMPSDQSSVTLDGKNGIFKLNLPSRIDLSEELSLRWGYKDDLKIKFGDNNPFINTKENGIFEITSKFHDELRLELVNRDAIQEIPSLYVNGIVDIAEGSNLLDFYRNGKGGRFGGVAVSSRSNNYGSLPIEVKIEDAWGMKKDKLIIDSKGEYFFVPLNENKYNSKLFTPIEALTGVVYNGQTTQNLERISGINEGDTNLVAEGESLIADIFKKVDSGQLDIFSASEQLKEVESAYPKRQLSQEQQIANVKILVPQISQEITNAMKNNGELLKLVDSIGDPYHQTGSLLDTREAYSQLLSRLKNPDITVSQYNQLVNYYYDNIKKGKIQQDFFKQYDAQTSQTYGEAFPVH